MGTVLIRIKVTQEWQESVTEMEWNKVSDTGNARDSGPCYEYVEYAKTKDMCMAVLDLVLSANDFDMDLLLCTLFRLQKTRP